MLAGFSYILLWGGRLSIIMMMIGMTGILMTLSSFTCRSAINAGPIAQLLVLLVSLVYPTGLAHSCPCVGFHIIVGWRQYAPHATGLVFTPWAMLEACYRLVLCLPTFFLAIQSCFSLQPTAMFYWQSWLACACYFYSVQSTSSG